MKKVLISIAVIAVIATAVGIASYALWSDTETRSGNSIVAGSLDLTVDGENGDIPVKFTAENISPGETRNLGTVTLKNVGTIDGALVLKVKNPISHENGILEPEAEAGDTEGVEIDNTGYDANEGDGELWDQLKFKFYVDLNQDGQMQWNEPVIYDGPMGLDMTSYYSIPLDENLFPANQGYDNVLSPDETADIGLIATFFNDQESPMTTQPQYDGMTNNQVMTDDVTFDLIFGLDQVTE